MDAIYQIERYKKLIDKFGHRPSTPGDDALAYFKRVRDPTTLEEMEWSLLMRPHCHFALPRLSDMRNEIEFLVSQGWTNHGWFNGSPIASLLSDDTGIRARAIQMKEANEEHRIISFWFDDDDTRSFLLTPPVGFY